MQSVFKYIRSVAVVCLILYCLYWVMQVTTCCSFHTPTESMTPVILPGDYGIVNKWKLGARIFDIPAAIEGKKVNVYRLPGFGHVSHNEIVVFNYPLLGKDTVCMNMSKYYCKRIVGLPGDTLEIINCRYRVRGGPRDLGCVEAQERFYKCLEYVGNSQEIISFRTWPYDSLLNWTVKDFGPLVIPRKGMAITMNRENTMLYGRYIAWEQQCEKPRWNGECAFIDGRKTKSYTFEENYYFTAGDKVENSADSRYWGLLPEPMIVGVAEFIWDSYDHRTEKRRWKRIFKMIN